MVRLSRASLQPAPSPSVRAPPRPPFMTWPPVLRDARWRLAAFMAFAAALNYADRAAMSSVLAAVRAEFGASDIELGRLGPVFLWSYAIGSPQAGRLADRVFRRRLVLGSLVAWSAVTALMGLAMGLPVLLAFRFALGLTECPFLPAAVALLAEDYGTDTRARRPARAHPGQARGISGNGGREIPGWSPRAPRRQDADVGALSRPRRGVPSGGATAALSRPRRPPPGCFNPRPPLTVCLPLRFP